MRPKTFHVYILSSRSRNLYIGMTSDLVTRVFDHKTKKYDSFTAKYNIDRLVYSEEYPTAFEAIQREKQLKGWVRERKIALIEERNPAWEDLSEGWYSKAAVEEALAEKQVLRSSG
jgi:putative endonuclease